jgi:hypothetical protein
LALDRMREQRVQYLAMAMVHPGVPARVATQPILAGRAAASLMRIKQTPERNQPALST